jgi:hypothetical protein
MPMTVQSSSFKSAINAALPARRSSTTRSDRAAAALAAMRLSISDAVRLLMRLRCKIAPWLTDSNRERHLVWLPRLNRHFHIAGKRVGQISAATIRIQLQTLNELTKSNKAKHPANGCIGSSAAGGHGVSEVQSFPPVDL